MGLGLENPLHLAIVLIVILMVFGAKRVPEIGRSLGEGIRTFKQSVTGDAQVAHIDDKQEAEQKR